MTMKKDHSNDPAGSTVARTQEHKAGLKDEVDATERESVRQARMEKEAAISMATRAAYEAQKAAESEETAPAARQTFWARFKKHMEI